jgi:hypothetical protein
MGRPVYCACLALRPVVCALIDFRTSEERVRVLARAVGPVAPGNLRHKLRGEADSTDASIKGRSSS